MSLCTRSVSGYEDMSHQSLLTNSASVTRGLGEAGHNTMDRSVSRGCHVMSRDSYCGDIREIIDFLCRLLKLIDRAEFNCAATNNYLGERLFQISLNILIDLNG